jgi:hypothetical protein
MMVGILAVVADKNQGIIPFLQNLLDTKVVLEAADKVADKVVVAKVEDQVDQEVARSHP